MATSYSQPKGVIDFDNPAHVKVALLSQGMRITDAAKSGLGQMFQEKVYSYVITDWVDKKIVFPSDIKLDRRVYAGFHYRPNSPFELTTRDSSLALRYDGNFLNVVVEHIPRPRYYDMRSSDGTPLQAIGVSCGNHGISFFVNDYCQYFAKGEECRFCSLVPTQGRFSDTLKYKKVEHVQECIQTVLDQECRIDFIQISGGSYYKHDVEVRNYIPYVKVIKEALERRGLLGRTPIHLTTMPPHDLTILDSLKSEGLSTISFDIECTSEQYFKKYCPGKAGTYGYSGMRQALRRAVDVFGEQKVYTIVIAGLEPTRIFVQGISDILQDGITPTLNIFHHDPLQTNIDVREPDPEELVRAMYEIAVLFKSHNAKPGLLGCAHYDIGHEIRKGYFDDTGQA